VTDFVAVTSLPPEEVETVGSAGISRRIYAYTLPGKDSTTWERTVGQNHTTGVGVIKVGETTKKDVRERIQQQLGTAYPKLNGVELLIDTDAERADGTQFRDHDVHRALVAVAGTSGVRLRYGYKSPPDAAVTPGRGGPSRCLLGLRGGFLYSAIGRPGISGGPIVAQDDRLIGKVSPRSVTS
jgi:hypothetical protein